MPKYYLQKNYCIIRKIFAFCEYKTTSGIFGLYLFKAYNFWHEITATLITRLHFMVLSFMNPIILLNKYLYCVVICKFRKRQKYATFCDIGVSIKFITFTAVIDSKMQFLVKKTFYHNYFLEILSLFLCLIQSKEQIKNV